MHALRDIGSDKTKTDLQMDKCDIANFPLMVSWKPKRTANCSIIVKLHYPNVRRQRG